MYQVPDMCVRQMMHKCARQMVHTHDTKACCSSHFSPKTMPQVASSPELYPLLVELNPLPTLLACVGHENTDIAADTLELLRELTDAGGGFDAAGVQFFECA